ncbi:MAG: ATP-dependent RNA helicase DbpA [Proteobacteria bacterium]|nr:ATP-dependent RNA helicase DbpA [Pseudomonadota bacterium]
MSGNDTASFESLDLRPELRVGLKKLGYTAMTDIQAKAIPVALAGRDVVGHARTGSGKTAAFGLALLQKLDLRIREPQALVLCPTRELAQQLTSALRALAVGLDGARILTVTGGMPSRDQRDALAAGAHVIVATPGRVLQHLELERITLEKVEVLVLDEADRMLDMGFEEQVNDIIAFAPTDRQTLLFSATWPDEMAKLSTRVQQDPEIVGVQALVDDRLLRQSAVLCDYTVREQVLCDVLAKRTPTPTLVFCETRIQCNGVAGVLQQHGASVLVLSGELEQRERDEVLVQLRNQSARVVVATNVAARGLDLEGLGLVVCYEPTPEPGVHVHRVGRTARASAEGEAVSLVAGARELRRFEAIEAHMNTTIPRTEWSPSGSRSLDGWSAPFRTLRVLGGRKDKLRPGDILGALTRDVGLEGSDVGKIEIAERKAWVAVRSAVARQAADGLGRTRIKKKRFRVHLL